MVEAGVNRRIQFHETLLQLDKKTTERETGNVAKAGELGPCSATLTGVCDLWKVGSFLLC